MVLFMGAMLWPSLFSLFSWEDEDESIKFPSPKLSFKLSAKVTGREDIITFSPCALALLDDVAVEDAEEESEGGDGATADGATVEDIFTFLFQQYCIWA